jgi:hypothetical protein
MTIFGTLPVIGFPSIILNPSTPNDKRFSFDIDFSFEFTVPSNRNQKHELEIPTVAF